MKYQKVTAIVRSDVIKQVSKRLHDIGVPGISVSKVKGYGEYADFYTDDWLTNHARFEIYTDETKSEIVAQAIMDSACSGMAGDGIIAIAPVTKIYHIKNCKIVGPE